MKPATNRFPGVVVQRVRRIALLQQAVLEHGHPVPHRHRLDLVVGHVHGRHGEAGLQLGELGTGLHPQLGVEVRERLVHQVHLRPAHDRPSHGDALTLAAGQVLRLAVEVRLEIEDPRRLANLDDPLGLRHTLLLEREPHVLGHGELRVERVVLEHHGDVPVAGPHVADVAVADVDRAAVERLEPGQHAQRRRLPRSRRTDEHEELAVGDLEIELVDRGPVGAGIEPCRRREPHRCHECIPRFT